MTSGMAYLSLKAAQQHPINYSKIAILAIMALVVSGIWIFGFDDELFGPLFPKHDSKVLPTKPVEIPIENNQNEIEPNKPTTTQNTIPSDEPKIVKTEPISSYQDKLVKSEDAKFDKTEFLETKEFDLDVSGTAYEGSPSLSKPADLELKLKPKQNTNLQKFDVLDARLGIGDGGINIDNVQVEIKDTQITISITSDDPADPYFTFVGTLDESLLGDNGNKQKVAFENQLLFLGKKDESTPHHLDLTGTLKHN